jgi:transcriptional regulator with XRE-family HTH domain
MAAPTKPIAPRRRSSLEVWIAKQKIRIGQCLRAHRESRGWTRTDAADAIGIHAMHLAKIELGRANVTLATLASIAFGYGVELHAFFSPPPKECA